MYTMYPYLCCTEQHQPERHAINYTHLCIHARYSMYPLVCMLNNKNDKR